MVEVCISGATGFVGRHLLDRLSREKDISTFGLSRKAVVGAGTTFTRGDLLDRDSVASFVRPGAVVVHLAYSPASDFDNAAAAQVIAEAAVNREASAFIHVSTAMVVGRCTDAVIDESTPCRPSSRYEQEKLEIEQQLGRTLESRVRLVVLRPTAIFGRGGQNLLSLVSFLMRASRPAIALRMAVMGKRRMNLVAAENVAEAMHHVIRMPGTERRSFIVTDDHAAGNHYTHVAQQLMNGLDMKPIVRPLNISFPLRAALRISGRALSNPATTFSAARLRATGYRPAVDFDESLRRFAASLRAERNLQ